MREGIMNGKLFTDECEGLPAERTAAKIKMKSFNMIILSMQRKLSEWAWLDTWSSQCLNRN